MRERERERGGVEEKGRKGEGERERQSGGKEEVGKENEGGRDEQIRGGGGGVAAADLKTLPPEIINATDRRSEHSV